MYLYSRVRKAIAPSEMAPEIRLSEAACSSLACWVAGMRRTKKAKTPAEATASAPNAMMVHNTVMGLSLLDQGGRAPACSCRHGGPARPPAGADRPKRGPPHFITRPRRPRSAGMASLQHRAFSSQTKSSPTFHRE